MIIFEDKTVVPAGEYYCRNLSSPVTVLCQQFDIFQHPFIPYKSHFQIGRHVDFTRDLKPRNFIAYLLQQANARCRRLVLNRKRMLIDDQFVVLGKRKDHFARETADIVGFFVGRNQIQPE